MTGRMRGVKRKGNGNPATTPYIPSPVLSSSTRGRRSQYHILSPAGLYGFLICLL